MERTLILCKPDCVAANLIGTVLNRFERAGLKVTAAKMLRLTPALLTEHYSHLKDRPFFPEILAFMQSQPVFAVILTGKDAVAKVRELLGPRTHEKPPRALSAATSAPAAWRISPMLLTPWKTPMPK